VVLTAAGDIPTLQSLAASVLLREVFPDLKVRFINVIDVVGTRQARDGLPRQNAATLAHAAGGSQTLVGYRQAHLHHLQAGDYFCILAHIEMNATHHMLPQTMG
jgi:hypothetical protein